MTSRYCSIQTKLITLFFLLAHVCFSQSAISFQKKKNPKRHFEISPSTYCEIQPVKGKRIRGYIHGVSDSVFSVRIVNTKLNLPDGEKIMSDRTIRPKDRYKKYMEWLYSDSLMLPFSSVKRIVFYNLNFKRGAVIVAADIAVAIITSIYLRKVTEGASYDSLEGSQFIAMGGIMGMIMADYYILYSPRIVLKNWDAKQSGSR